MIILQFFYHVNRELNSTLNSLRIRRYFNFHGNPAHATIKENEESQGMVEGGVRGMK